MRGYTLIELLAVLTLFGVGASTLAGTARRWADVAAVRSAREEVIAALSQARMEAMVTGNASVFVTADPPAYSLVIRGRPPRSSVLDPTNRLAIVLGGGRDSTEVRFGRLGIGRFANETIGFRRGTASASVIVSSYGRVRRQ